jgi:DNA-binding IclR family transcriptional regulator
MSERPPPAGPSGVGVLDKASLLLDAVAEGACGLTELGHRTGFSRATVHRLAGALVHHGLLRRDAEGRYALGVRLVALGRRAADGVPLVEAARVPLERLVAETGESAQLYVRQGDQRLCVASVASPQELRTIVAPGAMLPLERGSAGRILRDGMATGWLATVAERAPGVASVSAGIRDGDARVVAAVGISGPAERLGSDPGARFGPSVREAADRVEIALGARDGGAPPAR